MKAARAVWDGWILERSIIGKPLWIAGSDRFEHQTRQRFDYQLLVLVVQFLPQARLRDGDVDEVQVQLRHGSPVVEQIASPLWRCVEREHLSRNGVEASCPASR